MSDVWKEIIVDWQGDLGFVADNLAGGTVQINSTDENTGLSPMELLLAGLAGCTGSDVVLILEKKHKSIKKLLIKVRGKRSDSHPRVYTEINIHYFFWGEELDHKSVSHAIQLSSEKYCSASAMLGCLAKINLFYEINYSEKILGKDVTNLS